MTTNIITLDIDTSLKEAINIFLDHKIDGAPVMDKNKVVGLLTKTHLLRAVSQDTDLNSEIAPLMTREIKTLEPEEDIRDVDIMFTGRYPVMSGENLLGFITKSDIMVALNIIIEEMSGQMETVVNSAYNPIIAIDDKGIIRIWNKAAEKITSLNHNEVMGSYINDIIPESDLLSIVKTGISQFGIKLKVGNKTTITNRAPILKNGEITGAVAVLYDVSEIEQISSELETVKALNKELDAIIQSSFDGLYITDGNGKTLRINPAIKRMTDLGEKELLNKTMEELVKNGVLSRSASLIVLEERKPVTTTLTTVTGKTLLVSANPVFDENNKIIRVVTNVRDISELNRLKQKLEQLEGLKNHYEFQLNQLKAKMSDKLIYKNKEMEKIIYQAMKVAEVDSTVLITGESGVGKELIAEIIHRNSSRNSGPFIKINITAIPENLLESELFGYEAGAFTGASKEGKAGMFELANEGTLLIDEIGDLPLHLQVKLLRVIQQREIIRIGATNPIKIDVRIIAITNKDLEKQVNIGDFRKDLYYRINVVPIYVPALRDRVDDIPLLVAHFLDNFNQRYNLHKKISSSLIASLMNYQWPGNIRQLENLIERLVVTSSTELIDMAQLPTDFFKATQGYVSENLLKNDEIIPLKEAVELVERLLLTKAFELVSTYEAAGEILDIDSSTVYRKVKKYNILK
ncbi:MAG: sigma 54-interacting transcriptional regulator [Syntrophomonadaceae bacterium]|nr:sigma 54-interacting transcriptional regulator [Syntrophomonadaceae bacterium]